MKYIGHIGYGINKEYRGKKYSYKACRLLKTVMVDHQMDHVIITCNPDNYASRNTCELLGAQLIEIVEVPKNLDIYSEEESQKCRYEWKI
jgi:tagatose 1,6-diphosphate aldolase